MIAEVTHPLEGEWMTPRRRFLSAIYRGHVDKVPACTLSSVVTVEMMDLVNAPFPEAHLDAELMARLAATAHDVFGMDTIMPVFHSQLESDAGLYDCTGPIDALVAAGAGRPFDNNSPAELGARTVEILDAAYRSAASGAAEHVRITEDRG